MLRDGVDPHGKVDDTGSVTGTATRYRGVVVGSSLGGIEALQVMLGALRTELAVPIVLAHHVAPAASMLEKTLSRTARLPVRWAVDGAPVEPGVVHLCPARATVRSEPDGTFTVHPHERPSSLGVVDDLFASAADALGPHALAIVLSGAGSDGTAGARAGHDLGGTVVVQDQETALAAGMPGSVAAAGLADLVLPLAEIPELLDRVIGRGGTLPLPEVLAAEAMFAAGGEMGADGRDGLVPLRAGSGRALVTGAARDPRDGARQRDGHVHHVGPGLDLPLQRPLSRHHRREASRCARPAPPHGLPRDRTPDRTAVPPGP